MEKSFLFDAVMVDGVYDREYQSDDFCRYFSNFISNGVFPNPSTGLQVVAANDFNVSVLAGAAFINGRTYNNTSPLTFTLEVADGVLNRIDTVMVQVDHLAREIKTVIKKGTFAVNPVPPDLENDADYEEIQLAEIYIEAGAITITNADITDTRLDTSLCGIVHNTVDQIDTTTLYSQIQADLANFNAQEKAEFLAWFNGIKDILDESTAGNLLNLINGKAAANHIGINATATYNTNVVEITAPTDAVQIIFEAPSDFAETDTYTLNGTTITLSDLNNEPLFDAWKQGATVPLILKGTQAFFKSGGGAYGTLSPQIKQFTAKAGNHQIMLNWQNPSDANHAGTYLVRKQGTAPQKLSDGTKIDVGKATAYTDNEPENGLLYYYRAFTYNAKKQVQTELTGAVVSATPKASILLETLPVGTVVKADSQRFRIIHKGLPDPLYDASCNGVWFWSESTYGEERASTTDYSNTPFHTSIQNQYLNTLSDEFRSKIKMVKIPYRVGTSGFTIGEVTAKIFLLSQIEVGYDDSSSSYKCPIDGVKLDYFILGNNTVEGKAPRVSSNTNWLRSPFSKSGTSRVGFIGTSGSVSVTETYEEFSYRPAFILDNSIHVELEPNPDGSYNLIL